MDFGELNNKNNNESRISQPISSNNSEYLGKINSLRSERNESEISEDSFNGFCGNEIVPSSFSVCSNNSKSGRSEEKNSRINSLESGESVRRAERISVIEVEIFDMKNGKMRMKINQKSIYD